MMINCTICQKDVSIKLPGQYTDMLECGHIVMKSLMKDIKAPSLVEADEISKKLTRISELPKINSKELVERALDTVNKEYDDFFQAENPIIEDMIKEHGKDNTILMMTAIHAHLSKVLFGLNRFRNIYYVRIEQLRKEIEDKAVKELIQNHDFHYSDLKPSPKKIKTPFSKTGTDIDKAKEGLSKLTDKDGKPVDIMKVMGSLMWKDSKKDKEKVEYREGLDKIKEGIISKDK